MIRKFYGVCGHRDISINRFYGDPGSEIFRKLNEAQYVGQFLLDSKNLDFELRTDALEMGGRESADPTELARKVRGTDSQPRLFVFRPVDYNPAFRADLREVRKLVKEFSGA